ncbi:hypothetical protein C882_0439 [Caenispirillum salinarum AK4]|uniref:Uncharacterized protein n=1 Tax=Caenispirillum salinarum AK4 TaxID=1238182 RepID=K9GVC6_9PROT|nr:hypothetical protein C882_0439 [Caenispirillum salinarum AK4]
MVGVAGVLDARRGIQIGVDGADGARQGHRGARAPHGHSAVGGGRQGAVGHAQLERHRRVAVHVRQRQGRQVDVGGGFLGRGDGAAGQARGRRVVVDRRHADGADEVGVDRVGRARADGAAGVADRVQREGAVAAGGILAGVLVGDGVDERHRVGGGLARAEGHRHRAAGDADVVAAHRAAAAVQGEVLAADGHHLGRGVLQAADGEGEGTDGLGAFDGGDAVQVEQLLRRAALGEAAGGLAGIGADGGRIVDIGDVQVHGARVHDGAAGVVLNRDGDGGGVVAADVAGAGVLDVGRRVQVGVDVGGRAGEGEGARGRPADGDTAAAGSGHCARVGRQGDREDIGGIVVAHRGRRKVEVARRFLGHRYIGRQAGDGGIGVSAEQVDRIRHNRMRTANLGAASVTDPYCVRVDSYHARAAGRQVRRARHQAEGVDAHKIRSRQIHKEC